MKTVKMVVNKDYKKGNISPFLFGSFAEHMGRVIYSGLYEPGSSLADEDGEWQIGHKTAYEYGRLAAETSKAMKAIDPSIKTILCGSSLSSMPTFPDWEIETLELAYDSVDYISLHQYYGGQDKGTEAFLRQADDLGQFIDTISSGINVTKAKKRSSHDIKISMDEPGYVSLQ